MRQTRLIWTYASLNRALLSKSLVLSGHSFSLRTGLAIWEAWLVHVCKVHIAITAWTSAVDCFAWRCGRRAAGKSEHRCDTFTAFLHPCVALIYELRIARWLCIMWRHITSGVDWLPWRGFLPKWWLLFERLVGLIDLAWRCVRWWLRVLAVIGWLAIFKCLCNSSRGFTLLLTERWIRLTRLRCRDFWLVLHVIALWDSSWLQWASSKGTFDLWWIWIDSSRSHTLIRPVALFEESTHCLFLVLGGMVVNFRIEFLYKFPIFEFKVINLELEVIFLIWKSFTHVFPLVCLSLCLCKTKLLGIDLLTQVHTISFFIIYSLLKSHYFSRILGMGISWCILMLAKFVLCDSHCIFEFLLFLIYNFKFSCHLLVLLNLVCQFSFGFFIVLDHVVCLLFQALSLHDSFFLGSQLSSCSFAFLHQLYVSIAHEF